MKSKRHIIIGFIVLLLAGGAYQAMRILPANTAETATRSAVPPVAVAVTTVIGQSWQPSISATGSLRARQGVNVTAQEDGMVTAIYFDSGQKVSEHELLLQQYDLDEKFMLKSIKVQLELARKNYERNQDLVGNKAVSQSQLDSTLSDMERLTAEAEGLEALIAKRAIRAPFEGVLGIRRVNLGQHIEPGDNIVSLESLDPIYVEFALPQNRLAQVHIGQEIKIDVDAYPNLDFTGNIKAIESLIDPDTRSFQVEATVSNPDLKLRPGMFVSTRVIQTVDKNVLTLPQAAINYNPYGNSVFVVEDSVDDDGRQTLVAKSVFVTLGQTRGDQVAVLTGMQGGERVVTAGQLRLRNGSTVTIDNTIVVGNNPLPILENN